MSQSPIYVSDNDSEMEEIFDVLSDESSPPASPRYISVMSPPIPIPTVTQLLLPSALAAAAPPRQLRVDDMVRNFRMAELEQTVKVRVLGTQNTATNPYFANYLAGTGGNGGCMYPDVARALGFDMPAHVIGTCPNERKRKFDWVANPDENPRPRFDPFDDTPFEDQIAELDGEIAELDGVDLDDFSDFEDGPNQAPIFSCSTKRANRKRKRLADEPIDVDSDDDVDGESKTEE